MNTGDTVKIVWLPDNVADDVQACLGAVGIICAIASPNEDGVSGCYVRFGVNLPTKRFYENELALLKVAAENTAGGAKLRMLLSMGWEYEQDLEDQVARIWYETEAIKSITRTVSYEADGCDDAALIRLADYVYNNHRHDV